MKYNDNNTDNHTDNNTERLNEEIYAYEVLLKLMEDEIIYPIKEILDSYSLFSTKAIQEAKHFYDSNLLPTYKHLGNTIHKILVEHINDSLLAKDEWAIILESLHVNCGYVFT